MLDRIVTLVDMDCFYCQVEARLNPSLKGKPMAVVQYNQWKGGGIIAVNYEARDFGVTRSMRGDEAKKKCPDIKLVHVPALRGKADLTKYRDAGREVVDVLCQFSHCVQRASVDEAYIDITHTVDMRMKSLSQIQPSQLATTFVVGFCDSSNDEEERLQGLTSWLESIYGLHDDVQIRLAVAGLIVEEMRAAVFKQTGFRCSAGIAHNKILGKLACGLHKPNRQTILPQPGIPELYKTLPVRKVRNLGGKFGCMVEEQLGCTVMADLLQFSEHQLQQRFDEKTGTWLYNIARGIDNEPVTPRLLSKSIGCCKKFPGRQALATKADVEYWLRELAAEVAERLEKDLDENKRRAKLLCVSYVQDSSCSRSGPLSSYDPQKIANDAFDLLKKSNSGNQDAWHPSLKYLGISVGKFVDECYNQNSTLLNFFKTAQKVADTNCNDKTKEKADKTICSRDASHTGYDKESDVDSIQKQVKDSKGKVDENTNKAGGETSSLKNSFFLRYLKQKAVGSAIIPSSVDNSDDDMFENNDKSDSINKRNSLDLKSEQKIVSNSKITMTHEVTIAEANSKFENVIDVNFGASTSRVDDDAEDMCISLSEIFPDLDEVDSDVVDLLPSPMQKRLRTRIESREKQNADNEKLQKHLDRRKSIRKEGKCNESDNKMISELENNIHSESLDPGDVNGHSKQKLFKSGSDDDMRSQNLDTRIICENEISPQVKPQDQREDDLNSQHKQKTLKSRNSKTDINVQDIIAEDLDICEKENSPRANPQCQRADLSNKNKHKMLKSVNDETDFRKQGIVTEDSDVISGKSVCKSSNSTQSSVDSELVEKCPECGKMIHLSEYLEHLDFHTAERLHKELNHAPQLAPPRRMPTVDIPAKRKRGRPGKKTAVIGADKKLRSITAFFTPKQ